MLLQSPVPGAQHAVPEAGMAQVIGCSLVSHLYQPVSGEAEPGGEGAGCHLLSGLTVVWLHCLAQGGMGE